MVDAPESILFVSSQPERGEPMGAILIKYADLTTGITEGN
jgi:hypothetical protein